MQNPKKRNKKMITEAERLAVVETKIENVDKTVARIEQKLDNFTTSFVPREDMQDINRRMTRLENKNLLKTTFTWVALVASVILNVYAVFNIIIKPN